MYIDFILLYRSVLCFKLFYGLSLYISCNDYILLRFIPFMWFDLVIYIYISFVTLFTELASYILHTILEETMDFKRDNETFVKMYINQRLAIEYPYN